MLVVSHLVATATPDRATLLRESTGVHAFRFKRMSTGTSGLT